MCLLDVLLFSEHLSVRLKNMQQQKRKQQRDDQKLVISSPAKVKTLSRGFLYSVVMG